jgi:hypothetical protein
MRVSEGLTQGEAMTQRSLLKRAVDALRANPVLQVRDAKRLEAVAAYAAYVVVVLGLW